MGGCKKFPSLLLVVALLENQREPQKKSSYWEMKCNENRFREPQEICAISRKESMESRDTLLLSHDWGDWRMVRGERTTEKPTRLHLKLFLKSLHFLLSLSLSTYIGVTEGKQATVDSYFSNIQTCISEKLKFLKYDFWFYSKEPSDHFWNPKRVKLTKQGW